MPHEPSPSLISVPQICRDCLMLLSMINQSNSPSSRLQARRIELRLLYLLCTNFPSEASIREHSRFRVLQREVVQADLRGRPPVPVLLAHQQG